MASFPAHDLRVADRTELFGDQQDNNDNDSIPEDDAQRMNMLMQRLLGSEQDDQDDQDDQDEQQDESMVDAAPDTERPTEEGEEGADEDAFAFRLFSSKPVAQVNLKEDEGDTMDMMAATVNKMRKVEQDDDRPEFQARIAAAAIDYDTLLAQSKWAYPALRTPAIDISNQDHVKEEEQKKQRPRKSKKRRDFEKAVASGRIALTPNMRDSRNEGGWPGWPGHRSPCAIITPVDHLLKHKKKYKSGASSHGNPGARGGSVRGARGGGAMRGGSRGRGGGARGGARGGGAGGRGGSRGASSGRGGFRPRSS
ncbi:hypothetical protein BCR43DRAFT_485630 [Syncephalastrum racemosum]|uniref:Uncharacterized protein n=1 Tax=Syncephalastrum racemosum TaxID=13706 RepID=A0A1X2HN07_SYNRA|nr:hypothetical protein BCR43DRAFT_485630 [Syncephalastrum racemosum]